VDELRLWVFPVVMGAGKRLFGQGAQPRGLTLVDSSVSTSGVLVANYELAGPVEPGSFAFEEPTEKEIERREAMKTD
jgi:dihydrofolate reductase